MTLAFARLSRAAIDTYLMEQMLSASDPRPAKEQLDSGYQHGGGWQPMEGWTLIHPHYAIAYPGDQTLFPLAVAKLRDELVLIYPHDFVAIVQKGGKEFEIPRMT